MIHPTYDLVMVTTFQNHTHINNLISSIDNNNVDVRLLLIAVSQNCDLEFVPKNQNVFINFLHVDLMSLSKARNLALRFLSETKVNSRFIMFPDDDSTFDAFFFKNFNTVVQPGFNYITPIFNTGTDKYYLGNPNMDEKEINIENHNLIGSPNQILDYELSKEEIFFNENLGVGATYGSCEDLELFIRLSRKGRLFFYTSKLFSYHPDKKSFYYKNDFKKIISRFRNYSSGFAFLIIEYKFYRWIPNFIFRSFAASFYYFLQLKFKLSISYFIQAIIRVKLLLIIKKNFLPTK